MNPSPVIDPSYQYQPPNPEHDTRNRFQRRRDAAKSGRQPRTLDRNKRTAIKVLTNRDTTLTAAA